MSRSRLFVEAGATAAAVIVLVILGGLSLKKSFACQKKVEQRRLQKFTATLLEHAHHVKDDLAIQETVFSLGKAPGVLVACVVGNNGNIAAHSQPSQLGRSFHRSSLPTVAWPLYEEQNQWGTFVLALSDKTVNQAWLRELKFWGLGGVLLWGIWMIRALDWTGRLTARDRQLSDLSMVMEEEKQKRTRALAEHRQAEERWAICLRESLNQFHGAIALLDHRQKLIGLNPAAARELNLNHPETWLGKSWQELPGLQDLGEALQNSLNAPGILIGQLLSDGSPIALLTVCDTSKVPAGTWITFV